MPRQSQPQEPSQLREGFTQLLKAYRDLRVPQDTLATRTALLRTLLEQFKQVHHRSDVLESTFAMTARRGFPSLLDGYARAVENYRVNQERVAEDFNLLEVMQLTGKEIRHSMVLAWLLDHEMRRLGTHAQGKLGFRLFLHEFRELGLRADYADCNYRVRRDVAGDESIVDLEIACRGGFLIQIENKIWAGEGTDQTDREWADLQRRAGDLNVRVNDVHALYLTPNGSKPANPNFRAITWGRIALVLHRFAEQAIPPDVKLFAAHYVRALRRFIVTQHRTEESHGEGTV